jgi:hypothetical protein
MAPATLNIVAHMTQVTLWTSNAFEGTWRPPYRGHAL